MIGAVRSIPSPADASAFYPDANLEPLEASSALELDDFIRTLQSPLEALMRNRLQIRLSQTPTPMTDREALELDPLARWKSKDQLLKGLQDNQDEQTLLELQRALGMLSPGTLGEADEASRGSKEASNSRAWVCGL